MEFDTEQEKNRRLDMTEKLQKQVFDRKIQISSELFDSIAYIYTESQ